MVPKAQVLLISADQLMHRISARELMMEYDVPQTFDSLRSRRGHRKE